MLNLLRSPQYEFNKELLGTPVPSRILNDAWIMNLKKTRKPKRKKPMEFGQKKYKELVQKAEETKVSLENLARLFEDKTNALREEIIVLKHTRLGAEHRILHRAGVWRGNTEQVENAMQESRLQLEEKGYKMAFRFEDGRELFVKHYTLREDDEEDDE